MSMSYGALADPSAFKLPNGHAGGFDTAVQSSAFSHAASDPSHVCSMCGAPGDGVNRVLAPACACGYQVRVLPEREELSHCQGRSTADATDRIEFVCCSGPALYALGLLMVLAARQ